MNRGTKKAVFAALLIIWFIGMCAPGLVKKSYAKTIPNAYIIQVADSHDVHDICEKMAGFTGGKIGYVYSHAIRGFSIRVPPGIAKSQMLAQKGVMSIEPDLKVELCAQTIPTSVDRIDIDLYNTAKIDGIDERIDVDIAVIDTGIDTNHPDLNVVGGVRFLPGGPPTDYDDDNGHGSEVAGIMAALDNNIGIVGVAPGARLWSIKCFDQNRNANSGSDILAGIDWVVGNAATIEILNMSWRGIHNAPYHRQAIQNCVAAGVVCFAAAGNDARDVYGPDGTFGTLDDTWPAYFPEVAAISAMADTDGMPGGLGWYTSYGSYPDDSFAGFSNYSNLVIATNPVDSPGRAIDLMMPGVDIYSTFLNGGYSYDSGTSLASPLAAGLAALYIAENGRATNAVEVYAIRQALIDSATVQASVRGLDMQNDPDAFDENIGYYTPGDFNKNGIVRLEDFGLFASAWLTADGDAAYCRSCDIGIPADDTIGSLDLSVFVDNWLVGSE